MHKPRELRAARGNDSHPRPYPAFMRLPVPVRRRGFQLAYAVLCVVWFVFRPASRGVKCVITDGDRLLLVRHSYGPRGWEIPGGGIRRHEPPPTAARRETHEELGLDLADWTALGTITGRIHQRQVTLHCFHTEVRDPNLVLAHGEIDAADWFDRHHLPDRVGKYVKDVLELLDR